MGDMAEYYRDFEDEFEHHYYGSGETETITRKRSSEITKFVRANKGGMH